MNDTTPFNYHQLIKWIKMIQIWEIWQILIYNKYVTTGYIILRYNHI